jgi:hypothetical protein
VRVSAGGGPVNEEKFTYEEGMHYVSIPALDGYSGLYTGSRWTPYNALSIECNAAVISHIIVTAWKNINSFSAKNYASSTRK